MVAINDLRDRGVGTEPGTRVMPLRRGPSLGVLPEGDLERIHTSVLDVLEREGVRIDPASAPSERLGAAGAQVDARGARVRFPRALVEDALALAPRELMLAARDPACDLDVNGWLGWLSTGGPAERAVDLRTDERRASTLADVVGVSRLVDALPQIGFAGPCPTALDVEPGSRSLHELHAMVANTSKHVQIAPATDAAGVEALVEIARVVAGGEDALRGRPVVSACLSIPAPLALDGRTLDIASALARAGVPCGFVAAPVAGASAPATVAGALVASAADVVASVVALQLLVPGAPTFLGSEALHTASAAGSSPGGPQDPLFQMAWVQVAHRLGLPARLGAFATGSRSSDWQAGMEGGISGAACWMTGPDLLAAAGLRDGGRVFSPIATLLDTELFDLIARIPVGFEADEEALAVEVIEEVGPGEHFLGKPHTLRHMREAWMSRFMDRDTWEAWEEADRPQPPERAHEAALEILTSHKPAPLPARVQERIREVIAEHERKRG